MTHCVTEVVVEIGFGVNAVGGSYFVLGDPVKGELGNATYLLAPDTVFVDVSAYVSTLEIKRGRERELDEYSTGTATVVLNDTDRTFDPAYSGSPYAGQITPMRRINITWRGLDLFTGWIDDWSVTYERGDQMSRVVAECVDGFGILANQDLSTITSSFSGDLVGTRINRVLNRAEVDFPASRSIDAGNTTLGATTFGENALAYLQACARAEAGYLFVAADGVLTFRNRLSTLNTPAGATFTDDPDAGGVPYRTITQRSTADLLYTRVTGTSETTGNEMTALDSAAKDDSFIRTLPLGRLLTADDIQTQSLVDYYLERFSEPELRFGAVTVILAACDEAVVNAVLRLDMTDVVSVQRSPLSVGAMIDRLSIVDGVKHRITTNPMSWVAELNFTNADTRSFLTLGDAVFGILGANRLAF